MAIIRTGVPCHTMQIILFVFYMHTFISFTFLTYSAQHFPQNARVHVQQV
jgi:hypothetical protein